MRKLLPFLALALLAGACREGAPEASPAPPTQASPPAGSPAPTGPPAGCQDATDEGQVELTLTDYAFEPACAVITGDQGPVLDNQGSFIHNLSVEGVPGIDADVQPGDVARLEATGLDPGTYTFFCKYHRSLGMTGTFVVEG